jgi:hypothetical protein
MSSTAFGREILGAKLSTTIELPYANSSGAEVNAESAAAFGRDVALALRAYLQA